MPLLDVSTDRTPTYTVPPPAAAGAPVRPGERDKDHVEPAARRRDDPRVGCRLIAHGFYGRCERRRGIVERRAGDEAAAPRDAVICEGRANPRFGAAGGPDRRPLG